MKRFYAFAIGLAMLVAPLVTAGIATADPAPRPMDYQQATDVVVMRGLSQRGVPFSWAGGGINGPTRGKGPGITTVGFDASGLMQYAYAGAGIKLPRSSGEMYRVGQKVLPQQARRGDLIFYGPEGTQSVAMYLGNGQMLEVGDVVQVSPVRANGLTPTWFGFSGRSRHHCNRRRYSKHPHNKHRYNKHPHSRHRYNKHPYSKHPRNKHRYNRHRCNKHQCSSCRCCGRRRSRRRCSRPPSASRGSPTRLLRTSRRPATCSPPTALTLSGSAEQARRDPCAQERAAVFGKLAVDHAEPVTASSTGCPCGTGR